MNRILLVVVLLCVSELGMADKADDYYTCVEYMNTNQLVIHDINVVIRPNDQGQLAFTHWNIPVPQPTFAQIDTIMPQALAWKSNQVATAAADIDKMDLQLKAVIRALVKVVNDRLPAAQKITETELKAAIKDAAR